MKKFFKWTGIILGSLIVVLAIAAYFIAGRAERELAARFTINVSTFSIPTDSASVDRGKHISASCWGCHGVDYSGKKFFDDPAIGTFAAANLTSGKGGVGSTFKDIDWIRAIHHGVGQDGRGLFIMPSHDFANLTEHDLGCLIAFLKTLPPIDNDLERLQFRFMGRLMYGLGLFGNALHVNDIDHAKPLVKDITPAVSADYGNYVVSWVGCKTCHGQELAGHKDPNPDAPIAPNLTEKGRRGKWTREQFFHTLRTGETPEGKHMNPEFMPWTSIGQLSDNELDAVLLYLKSIPPKDDAMK